MKIDINKVDLTNQNQRVFAGILLVLTLIGLYFLLPPFIVILKNIWIAAVLAVPLVFIVMNPMLIWNIYKQLSWNLTKALISQDKLGYMYRYHEYILMKIADLDKNIKSIGAIKVSLQRRLSELLKTVESNKKQASAYQKQNAPQTVIRTIANKINIDNTQAETLLPKLKNVESQEKYLRELYDHWVADAEDLKYTLDSKAEEYRLLKELSEVTGSASAFLKGNSEEYKLYQESLKQIEQSVTQYTANVEDFERKVRPMLDNLSAERTVSEEDGLKLIEEFKKNTVTLRIEESKLPA